MIEKYYAKDNDEIFYNFTEVKKKCNLEEKNNETQKIINYILSNIVIVEEEILNFRGMHQISIDFNDFVFNSYMPALNTLKERSEHTTRGLFIKNEIALIESIFGSIKYPFSLFLTTPAIPVFLEAITINPLDIASR